MNDMALKNWWQVCTPHEDILKGRFDQSVFAADLGDVINGKGPRDYQDAVLFYEKTYITTGLQELISAVLASICGNGKGQSVIQLQTSFGGGKTHSLLSLYHIVKNYDKLKHMPMVEDLMKMAGVKKIKDVKVAGFVGTHADPLKGRTPWGEIAYQLDVYDIVKDHDKDRIATGKEVLVEMLEKAGPSLILIDELLEYVVKKDRAEELRDIEKGQTLAFLQELTEAVSSQPNTALVLTLPASAYEQYDEQAEKSLLQLQKVSGREETIFTPVEGAEIYEVVRKRLFQNIGNEKTRKEVAQWFFSFYNDLDDAVPTQVRNSEYREKLERAYPFHPELIDALYHKWGSFPTFQRTRGVLRLMAEALGTMYEERLPAAVIQSSIMPLHVPGLKREFIKHIGSEWDGVLDADVSGSNAKAKEIDKQLDSELRNHRLATGLATSVFINSFSGAERTGIPLRELRVSLLREGTPKNIAGDVIKRLEEELWFFHSSNGQYSFRNQPNLNRIIVDNEERISEQDIETEIQDALKRLSKAEFETFLWPADTVDVPDTRRLKLLVFQLNQSCDQDATGHLAQTFYDKAGSGFRVYKNGTFVVATDSNTVIQLMKHARRLLALAKVQGDLNITEKISSADKKNLGDKVKQAKNQLGHLILTTYRHLAYMTKDGIRWIDMGIPTITSANSLTGRIKDFLVDEEVILTQISPKVILRHTQIDGDDEMSLGDIYEMYLKTPGLPLPDRIEVLEGAVRVGVQNGVFGLKQGDKVKFKDNIFSIQKDDIIISAKKAAESKDDDSGKPPYNPKDEEEDTSDGVSEGEPVSSGKHVKTLDFTTTVPWTQLSQLISGVFSPLRQSGDTEMEIKLNVKATSESGFDRITLDSRVKETLLQIGASIDKWQED
jgi:hypothetical protein